MELHNSENGYLATDAAILVVAFEDTVKLLGLVDPNDPATLVAATHIITFAKAGECDPARLRELTVKAIRQNSASR
jgi:hypothetical protein